MKILITSDWYLPAVNGVVTSVKNLRRELEARGHEVRVLTLSQNRHSCRKDGVTCLGSVAAGLIYPGARLRTALAGKWVRERINTQSIGSHRSGIDASSSLTKSRSNSLSST